MQLSSLVLQRELKCVLRNSKQERVVAGFRAAGIGERVMAGVFKF
jgi:hypothetical protein